jgi:hypothetical protein
MIGQGDTSGGVLAARMALLGCLIVVAPENTRMRPKTVFWLCQRLQQASARNLRCVEPYGRAYPGVGPLASKLLSYM